MANQHYHVFLVHHGDDDALAQELAHRLKAQGINPWVYSWNLIPGEPRQEAIEKGLAICDTCAILIGANGIEKWQNDQMRVALDRQATSEAAGFRVIPVLLPHAKRPGKELLPPFLSTKVIVEFKNSLDDQEAFRGLISGIKGIPIGSSENFRVDGNSDPYKGLDFFDVRDSSFFFGREILVEDLAKIIRLPGDNEKEKRFLGIIGPSGSGKSSLARAGLIANLNKGLIPSSESWPIVICTPGVDPLESLAIKIGGYSGNHQDVSNIISNIKSMQEHEHTLHLMTQVLLNDSPSSARFVLLLDQFEEIFTLCTDEKLRAATINNLLHAATVPGGKTIVVIVLRADFYGRCSHYQEFGELLSTHHKLVGPMSLDEVRSAIERPATQQGAFFESGLVDVLINDVRDQPGELPLLQDTLLELWRERTGSVLTHSAYNNIGGVKGALNQRAETIFSKFSDEEKLICRQIFLRLVEPGDGSEDTKRPATLHELISRSSGSQVDYERVINKLSASQARLLTIRTESNLSQSSINSSEDERLIVELSHEALIRSWKRLHDWISESRTTLRTFRRLSDAAKDWRQSGNNNDLLYRGVKLNEVNELINHSADLNISDMEREFVKASLLEESRVNQERQDQLFKEKQLISERQNASRLRKYLFSAIFLFLLSLIATVVAVQALGSLAEANKEIQALAYAADAQVEINNHPEKALILAYESSSSLSNSNSPILYRTLFSVFDNVLIRNIIRGHNDAITSVVWDPSGQLILTGSLDKTARIWNATDGKLIQELIGHDGGITSVAWSPDGQQILTGSLDGTVRIWDVASGSLVNILQGHKYAVKAVAWSPDGQQVLSASDDWTVRIWNPKTGVTLLTLSGHGDGVRSAAWSPDGKEIVSGGADRTVRIWNASTGESVQLISGYTDQVTSVSWSPDGTQILTGSLDNTIRIIDRSDITSVHVLVGHQYGITSVAWSPDGKHILTGSLDNTVRIWDSLSGINELTLRGYTDGVSSVAWGPQGNQVAGASLDRTIRIWNTKQNAILPVLIQHKQAITSLSWSPDGKKLITGSLDQTAIIWNISTSTALEILQDHTASVTGALWSPNGNQIITTSRDRTARIWNIEDNTSIILNGHTADVTSATWSPDGTKVITGSEDWNARIWDVKTGTTIEVLKGHLAGITATTWNPNGEQVATASSDDTIRIWDVATGIEVQKILATKSGLTSIAWSPDGQYIVTGGKDKIAHVWSIKNNREVYSLIGHAATITSVAWSPDGQYIVTGSEDKTARVWSITNGIQVRILIGHVASITSVTWSPDGNYIATGSVDKTAKIWYANKKYAIDSVIHQICDVYQNNDELIQAQLKNWQWRGCTIK